jgi:hypothetical protein
MNQKNLTLVCCLLALFLSACSGTETAKPGATSSNAPSASDNSTPGETTAKAPPADVVRAQPANVEIKAGGSTEASIKLTIAGGYHINANPPSFSYLKATELNVEPTGGITPGKPIYPASITRKFGFSKDPLAVYEGETEIKLPLSVAADAPKGAQTLKGKLRVQACDEEACYPPRTIETSIPVTVR